MALYMQTQPHLEVNTGSRVAKVLLLLSPPLFLFKNFFPLPLPFFVLLIGHWSPQDPWTCYVLWALGPAILSVCGQARARLRQLRSIQTQRKQDSGCPSHQTTTLPLLRKYLWRSHPGTDPLKQELERSGVRISKNKWGRSQGWLPEVEFLDEHWARIPSLRPGRWTEVKQCKNTSGSHSQ